MISLGSARALASTGLTWDPARGDRFVIADRDMDDEVFVLSDMTIETHEYRTGRVIGFNGTTEWALDSVDADDVLWLPGEGALRELLGPAFVRLESAGLDGWSVTASLADGGESTVTDADAEEAYALALLSVRATSSAALLPLAAHPVMTAAAELDARGDGAWTDGAASALLRLVTALRTHRARLAGEDAPTAAAQAALVEEADPVAEDRSGTLLRAVTAVLRHQGAPASGDGAGRDAGADALLVRLVLTARDLGSADLALVCVRRAVDFERAGRAPGEADADPRGADGAGRPSARAVQSLEAALAELDRLVGG